MTIESPQLGFPASFCCNCGATDCTSQIQETRITRFFGIGNKETTFNLSVPVCSRCQRTIRRKPAGFYSRLFVLMASFVAAFVGFFSLGLSLTWPMFVGVNLLIVSAVVAILFTAVFYLLRRPKAPQTSFYQPVRIKNVRLQVTGLMAGEGQVGFMRLAFTNPDYRNVFANANSEAIKAKRIAVTKA